MVTFILGGVLDEFKIRDGSENQGRGVMDMYFIRII